MLKQRIITAVILAIALLAASTLLSAFYFAIFVALIVLLAVWEWSRLIGLQQIKSRLAYLISLALVLVGLFRLLNINPTGDSIDWLRVSVILGLGLLFWILTLFMLWGYPENKKHWNDESKIASMGLFVLIPTWVGLVQLKYIEPNGYLVLSLIVLVAAVDIGAYFSGVNFGRRKLAPALSPNKTWEGVWGGFAVCLLLGLGLSWLMHSYLMNLTTWQFLLCLLLVFCITFFSVIGDLLESMLKRNRNIKNSGSLLPGHGGVLDRVDGLMAATPVFALMIMFILSGLESSR